MLRGESKKEKKTNHREKKEENWKGKERKEKRKNNKIDLPWENRQGWKKITRKKL